MSLSFHGYIDRISKCLRTALVTNKNGDNIDFDDAINWCVNSTRQTTDDGNKIIFIGNGGSAGISSHLAIDYSKNGNMRSLAFNDGPALTCIGNDLGYEYVFSKQLELHAKPNDMLVAISSSGESENILNAVKIAQSKNCKILTFSGFKETNLLRDMGDMNFYVNSNEYGFVEISHLTLGHCILDTAMGLFKV